MLNLFLNCTINKMSSMLVITILLASASSVPIPGELSTAFLDLTSKIYTKIEDANRPTQACFEMYEHKEYQGRKTTVCGDQGKCIELPSDVSGSVSSIKFLSGGRFFTVEKIRVFKFEQCTRYLDADGNDPYGSSNLVWNDGYHNCDGYNLFGSGCDKSFNDNINSIRF
ncbi:hypothetical protein [Thysanoplusia orichalcea nucleopolyhedrovirus]|uniref:Uncharacterized protein n=1 Tax=Thysanoplusia orichalcea nucleopolyhedrovirus TaxID=101850 RepID=L0CL59_9ABAC|nr:hypothetical protein [Thysanoplusia orichalcea nucleopolyhedrovirus]AGA16185.1 hypothetical protein [Thysanoplusia orichalcea nucleopolyhedrovirus]